MPDFTIQRDRRGRRVVRMEFELDEIEELYEGLINTTWVDDGFTAEVGKALHELQSASVVD